MKPIALNLLTSMPAITPPSTVLVTGASGFIAVHTIQSILDKGFHVVGTVRSASKGHYLEKLFGDKYPGKFSFAIVEDIQKVCAPARWSTKRR